MIKVKDIEQQGQTLFVLVNLPDAKLEGKPVGDATIHIPIAAIGSRMVMYNLSTPGEAFEAIVLEHARRTNKELPNPQDRDEAVALYQEDAKKMKMEVTNSNKVNALLDHNLSAIQEAIVLRMPDVNGERNE